jgi:uncharacterized protein YhbP (UPF0306 family)
LNGPDKQIINFLKKHHVFNLATSVENHSWCCSCFYAIIEDEMAIVFTSDQETRHVKDLMQNPEVSGTVHLETWIIGKIKGVQFSGTVELAKNDKLDNARKVYLKRFPFAALVDTTLWILNLNYIKMTDNKFGFGKKLIWERK